MNKHYNPNGWLRFTVGNLQVFERHCFKRSDCFLRAHRTKFFVLNTITNKHHDFQHLRDAKAWAKQQPT